VKISLDVHGGTTFAWNTLSRTATAALATMKVNLKQACAAKVLVDKENEGLLHELKQSVVEVDKLRCLAEEHRVSKSSRSSDTDSSMRGTPPLSSPSPIKVCGVLIRFAMIPFISVALRHYLMHAEFGCEYPWTKPQAI
jgi:hypothetical protein